MSTTGDAPAMSGGLQEMPSEKNGAAGLQDTDPESVGHGGIEAHSSPARGVWDAEGPFRGSQAGP